jgi:hypothetical protein
VNKMYLCLLLVLLIALPAAAQSGSTASNPDSSFNAAPTAPQGISPDLMKAPQPGHPLDMRDVTILTGKDKAQDQYSRPQMYYNEASPYYNGQGYPTASQLPLLGGGGLLGSSALLSASPTLMFRNRSRGPFFFFGDTTRANLTAPLFFGGRSVKRFHPRRPLFPFAVLR